MGITELLWKENILMNYKDSRMLATIVRAWSAMEKKSARSWAFVLSFLRTLCQPLILVRLAKSFQSLVASAEAKVLVGSLTKC